MATKPKFHDLARDVDWQFRNLFNFIVEYFRVPMGEREGVEKAVQDVLDDYLYLVAKFYLQFRGDLEKEYTRNKSVLANEVPVLMQQALDKLAKEWERVYSFIALNPSSKMQESQEFIERLAPVINAASLDMGFSSKFPVIPQFGNAYSLGFFNYSDDFSALNVPLQKIKSPWEWTIFWHELAGLKVRLLVKTQVEFENLFQELFNEVKTHPEVFKEMADEKDKNEIDINIDGIAGILWVSLYSNLYKFSEKEKGDFQMGLHKCVADDYRASSDSTTLSVTHTKKFFQVEFPMVMFSFDHFYSEIMDELLYRQRASVMGDLFASLKGVLIPADTHTNVVMDEFVRAMEKALALKEDFAAQKQALTEKGWSGDWLEELFEDSFSVMNFNLEFLFLFDSLLSRYKTRDQRHPPHNVRLAVALSVKLLSFKEGLGESETLPSQGDWPIWNKELMGLNNAKEYKSLIRFYSEDLMSDAEIVWLVARKIWNLHKCMQIPNNDTNEKRAIAEAMAAYRTQKSSEWMTEWEKVANRAFNYEKPKSISTNKTRQPKSNKELKLEQFMAQMDRKAIDDFLKTKSIRPLPLGYRELLELSFYDVDFAVTVNPEYPIDLMGPNGIYSSTSYKITKENLNYVIGGLALNRVPTRTDKHIRVDGSSYSVPSGNYGTLLGYARRG